MGRESPGGTLLQLVGPDWGAAKGRGARRKKVMTARRRLAGQGDTRFGGTRGTQDRRGANEAVGVFAAEARTSGDTLLNYGQTANNVRAVLKLRREQLAETETEVGERWMLVLVD